MMERAVENATQPEVSEAKIPRSYPGGSYTIQRMGRLIDRLTGDRRARADAADRLEPFLTGRDDPHPDPEPAEP
jgi:hypothetical protein